MQLSTMKKYLLPLMLPLIVAISCDVDKLTDELDNADFIAPDYDGILALPIGTVSFTVDSLLNNLDETLEYTVASDGLISISFNEPDSLIIDDILEEQPDLDFDVELAQTVEVAPVSFAIDFFDNLGDGTFEIENPELSFYFENSLQIPSSLIFKEFKASKYDENGNLTESKILLFNNIGDTMQAIGAPTRMNTAPVETTISINAENTNFRDLLAMGPDSLTLEIGLLAFPYAEDTLYYFRVDTLGPYIVGIDDLVFNPITSEVDTIFYELDSSSWSPADPPSEIYNTTQLDTEVIIPIYVATANEIVEVALGTDQNDDGFVTQESDLQKVFNTSTGKIEEGMDQYVSDQTTFTHSSPTYKLFDTLFVGTNIDNIDPNTYTDPDGNVAWAIAITKWSSIYGLNAGAKINYDVIMNMPLELRLTNIGTTREIEFNNKNDITNLINDLEDNNQSIPAIALNLVSENDLPLDANVSINFLDVDSAVIHTIIDAQLIASAILDADGDNISPGLAQSEIVLSAEGIEALKTTQTIELLLTLNTPDSDTGSGVFAQLKNTYTLDITISIKVTN
ncbi:MAG: hypothetical protein HQ474_11870 [Flammeovirgaceae bacterium]|nr:hypothetical protein [Flammeovirgaceae bacterium]